MISLVLMNQVIPYTTKFKYSQCHENNARIMGLKDFFAFFHLVMMGISLNDYFLVVRVGHPLFLAIEFSFIIY